MSNPVHLDPTPARISTNLSIDRQTPKTDFGDRLKSGLDQVGGAVANGAAVVGGMMPGGAIVSAAVSSVSNLSAHGTPGGGAVSSAYGMSGAVSAGGGSLGGGSVGGGTSTTIGGTGGPSIGSTVGGQANLPTSGTDQIGGLNAQLIQSQSDNAKMMNVQIQMQRENQVFTSVSNVLKGRHDTVKNSIGNIR